MPEHDKTAPDFDLIVIGTGPAGMMAAISAARCGRRVLLLEKLAQPGTKLKATGGGRCNLANTLDTEEFIKRFGKEGRFMTPALKAFDHSALMAFFEEIGVKCHAPDGMRIFPVDHNATTVVSGLTKELTRLHVSMQVSNKAAELICRDGQISGIISNDATIGCTNVILATGGRGYPTLGSTGDGFAMAKALGHTITDLFPAMLPLTVKESWVKNCRADTIGKAEIRINLPEARKLQARGDLIFTGNGIRGPVVLDFAREITPLLQKYGEVPLLINLTRGLNEEELRTRLNNEQKKVPNRVARELVAALIPMPLAIELCNLSQIDPESPINKQPAAKRDQLLKILCSTPLTVIGHHGWDEAMVTRGGISLKEVRPETLESRLIKGLYFCGEILNLDGPCGGFNLHWCFASGLLAGRSAAKE